VRKWQPLSAEHVVGREKAAFGYCDSKRFGQEGVVGKNGIVNTVAVLVGKGTTSEEPQPWPEPAKYGRVARVEDKVEQPISGLPCKLGRKEPGMFQTKENLVHGKLRIYDGGGCLPRRYYLDGRRCGSKKGPRATAPCREGSAGLWQLW